MNEMCLTLVKFVVYTIYFQPHFDLEDFDIPYSIHTTAKFLSR